MYLTENDIKRLQPVDALVKKDFSIRHGLAMLSYEAVMSAGRLENIEFITIVKLAIALDIPMHDFFKFNMFIERFGC